MGSCQSVMPLLDAIKDDNLPPLKPHEGAFTNPLGPVRFSNPAACRRILRPCGTLPNFISTAFMVTYPTEHGRCPVDI